MESEIFIQDESTVLVIDGVPYSRIRYKIDWNIVVCDICDLRELCYDKNDNMTLIGLCKTYDNDPRWFFQRDWDILENKIRNYIDLGELAREDKL